MTYPHITIDNQLYDIYDLAKLLGISNHAHFNAFKKLIRCGNGAKSIQQDLAEVKQSVDRYLKDLDNGTSHDWNGGIKAVKTRLNSPEQQDLPHPSCPADVWLLKLPSDYRILARKRCEQAGKGWAGTSAHHLSQAFPWNKTKAEGCEFWEGVAKWLDNKGNPLPPIPSTQSRQTTDGSSIAPGHNPDKLTVAQVGEGYRLLRRDEIRERETAVSEIQYWAARNYWGPRLQYGDLEFRTYRVPCDWTDPEPNAPRVIPDEEGDQP